MTAHITLPPRRSDHGPYWVAWCSCGYIVQADTADEARDSIKEHQAQALAEAEGTDADTEVIA